MPADLPLPGTVWLHKATKRLMRAVHANGAIVLHNCELSMRENSIPMCSWSGTLEEFDRAFKPASTAAYPPTAPH